MKKIEPTIHPYELEIGMFLSSDVLTSDPRNHCVRILETLSDPFESGVSIIVMPYLRPYDDPLFDTIGEAVSCFKQLIEGLRVMHEHHMAHRDISTMNIMMDATTMFPDLWHPESPHHKYDYSGPVKYYYIDFGLSCKYDPKDGTPQELPILGGDKSVPEFQDEGYNKPSNPFCTDIYYLGNLMRTEFLRVYRGFGFMHDLVADMVQDDPAKWPTIEEVEWHFNKKVVKLTPWKLRSRLVRKNEWLIERAIRGMIHTVRTAKYLAKRLPPLPVPDA